MVRTQPAPRPQVMGCRSRPRRDRRRPSPWRSPRHVPAAHPACATDGGQLTVIDPCGCPQSQGRGLTLLTTLAATIATTVLAAVSVLLVGTAHRRRCRRAAFVWLSAGVQVRSLPARRASSDRAHPNARRCLPAPAADRECGTSRPPVGPFSGASTTSVGRRRLGAAVDGVATEAPTKRPTVGSRCRCRRPTRSGRRRPSPATMRQPVRLLLRRARVSRPPLTARWDEQRAHTAPDSVG